MTGDCLERDRGGGKTQYSFGRAICLEFLFLWSRLKIKELPPGQCINV